MAITNHERVGKSLELLNAGLKPFVEREMLNAHGEKWFEIARQSAPGNDRLFSRMKRPLDMDTQALLTLIWDQWNQVFSKILGHAERSLVSELRDTRNRWAHQNTFSTDDAYRALDSVGRLLTAVSADQSGEIEKMKTELLRVRFEDQRRNETRKVSIAPVEGTPAGNFKPWREVVTPHQDVASGNYQKAEFAADLWQVYLKEGSDEYKHPVEFFRRTFITDGLEQLLKGAISRLAGKGGDPVVELQTNFGGGKTHSMLALYHLFSGTPAQDLPGIEMLLKESGTPITANVKRAVLVGTKISPGRPSKKPDGALVHTLWGEIAWQLGGKEGYNLLKEDDEKATNPGDRLKEVFNRYAPCLILIDEWVAYARQLHEGSSLPAGSFDTQFTFAQTLSESAKSARQTMLVVSIPSSENEVGGDWGRAALARLKNAVGRVESSWRPASPDEGFEIVRRRLFQPMAVDQFPARDAVARAFVEMYGSQHQEFPMECREADYERRIKMAYPIHPELFDRLFADWSTLDKFQRTRGVLRLMAAVIHSLWERQDGNLLIMPASVSIDDPCVQFELTRYLDDQWVPVIEKDVDGPHCLPLALDRDNPNLGRYSACRRVARTIYIGSAPTLRAANRGIEERRVKLGCVQPGEAVATFGDALRRLTDRATYLYVDGKRYWYSTQRTVTRLAEDRAGQLSDDQISDEIIKRLREQARFREDFSKVHACVQSSDIPDEKNARLVILGPEFPHSKGENGTSEARREAEAILNSRGTSPRNYRNTLVFLAGDTNRLRELEQAVRQYLAWSSIGDEHATLNLDEFQKRQAETRKKNADEAVDLRISEAYQWLLVASQADPKGEVSWAGLKLQGQESLAGRAAKKLKNEESLLVQMGAVRLRMALDRIPLWAGNHVGVKELAEYMARYLYLPRLRDEQVLFAAIQEGVASLMWQTETFAYAEGWDEQRKVYQGLRAGQSIRVIADDRALLVKPEAAAAQLAADRQAASTTASVPGIPPPGPAANGSAPHQIGGDLAAPATAPALRRFHGVVRVEPLRLGRDAARIAEEVVQHLTGLVGTNVEITIEIRADLAEGASEKTVRAVSENCRTLKFDNYGFEER
jgi:predicted AAA+ superfamily ATPase